MSTESVEQAAAWDQLHMAARFRPRYPSESVVRFVSRNFGGVDASPERPATLLDLGCGAGRHTAMMSTAGHRVVAIDYSLEGLRHTGKWMRSLDHDVPIARASMVALPFGANAFDGVVAYGVVNYTDRAGFHAAVGELWRVTRSGGRVLVVTRSQRDHRFGRGVEIEPGTYVLSEADTNEQGMLMHFVDERGIDEAFRPFSSVVVDTYEHSSAGRAIVNADWVIEAVR